MRNFFGFLKKDSVIGLDLGFSSIKVAQFVREERGLRLVHLGLEEIEPTADKGPEREKAVLAALQKLFRGIDTKQARIIPCISSYKTAIKRVVIPYMPRAELKEAIALDVKNYFLFPTDETFIDFEILGEFTEHGAKKYSVLVAVSPRKTIEGYLTLLGKLGIRPASFIPALYGLEQWHRIIRSRDGRLSCFVDIGALNTELVIFPPEKNAAAADEAAHRGGMFSRKIPVTGNDFTKAMEGVLVSDRGRTELSEREAEAIKRETGIPAEGDVSMIRDTISANQLVSMLRQPAEQLSEEIERCFDYYREENAGGRIAAVTLLGGGASLKGLDAFLARSLGIEVAKGDPLEGLTLNPNVLKGKEGMAHRFGFAVGAALSEGRGINLLPVEVKEQTKRTVTRVTFQTVVIAAVLVAVLVYMGMGIQLANLKNRVGVATRELASLQPQLRSALTQQLADKMLVDEPYWEEAMRELSNILPRNVHLAELSFKDRVLRMRGTIMGDRAEEALSDFIITLERGIFANVKLVQTRELEGKAGNEFEVRCWLDAE